MLDNVLVPAGMDEARVDSAGRLAVQNRAHPHARINGTFRGDGAQVALDEATGLGDNVNPAGGIAASAEDMAAWLKLQLGRGNVANGRQLYSEAQAAEMWKPLTLMPIGAPPPGMAALQPKYVAYASGWSVRDYRGAKVLAHSGAVLGAMSFVALIPERNIGFSMAINSEDEPMVRGLVYELLDHYLGLPKGNWPEKLKAQNDQQLKKAMSAVQAASAPPPKSIPSLALADYAGAYADAWFGMIEIKNRDGKLSVAFPHSPGLTAELSHWQYDTFKATFKDPSVDPILVTFGLDAEGKVAEVRMKPASPLGGYDYDDLLFKPVSERER